MEKVGRILNMTAQKSRHLGREGDQ